MPPLSETLQPARPSSWRRWLPHTGTVLAAILIVAAFPPWDLGFLAWFCLIPWFFALSRTRTFKESFAQGLWFSILMSILGFHWVAYVLHQFGELPWVVSCLGLFLFSLIGQPQFLFFAPIYFFARKFRSRTPWKALLWTIGVCLLYAGLDWFLPKLFKDTLGHAFYSSPWIRQGAEIGGAHLLTFVAVWTNLALYFTLEGILEWKKREAASTADLKETLKAPAATLLPALLAVLALCIFGARRESQIRNLIAHAPSSVQVGIIQANIGDFDKVAAESGFQNAAEKILTKYLSLSDQALSDHPKPDFLVWPETAYSSTYRKPMTTSDYLRDQRIDAYIHERHIPLLFGGYDRDKGKDYNALFAVSPYPLSPALLPPVHSSGNDMEYYRKNILLMFGEYVPFQDSIPGFDHLFPQIANFGRGIGPDVLEIPLFSKSRASDSNDEPTVTKSGSVQPAATKKPPQPSRVIPVSPVICYEVLFPNYVIRAARMGSRLILNITNDSWFGPYGEPHLHLALSTFRTIETRLPMVRSTNTGFSALVLPDGSIARKSKLFKTEALNVTVPLIRTPDTLMKRWGDWFGKFALLTGLLILGTLRLAESPLLSESLKGGASSRDSRDSKA